MPTTTTTVSMTAAATTMHAAQPIGRLSVVESLEWPLLIVGLEVLAFPSASTVT